MTDTPFVVVRRHFESDNFGASVVSAGWAFECPGCYQLHYMTTLTYRTASEWELLIHGDYGEKISFRQKKKPNATDDCVFSLRDNHIHFGSQSKHAKRGKKIPFILQRA